MSKLKMVSFSAPSKFIKKMQEFAKKENKTISELLIECFRQYTALKNLTVLSNKGKKAVKSKKLTRQDIGYEVE